MNDRENIFVAPSRPLVFASILGADFTRIGEEAESAMEAGADALHVDVMDGHFVPNLTMGPKMVADLRRRLPGVFLDVHLMVEHPQRLVGPFAEAGADALTFHIEATQGRAEHDERDLIKQVRSAGCHVGLAINPPTDAARLRQVAGEVDLVLVMSVHPGFAGQAFLPEILEKTRRIRPWLADHARLAMDGGLGAENAERVREAGCDVLVAANALFSATDRARMVRLLRGDESG